MKTVTQHLRDRLLSNVFITSVGDKTETLDSLNETEWSKEFETHQRNRLIMGRFRYGLFNRTTETNYNRTKDSIRRIKEYEKTGNLEYLVDAANMLMIEYEHSSHPNKHFEATDDGQHAKII